MKRRDIFAPEKEECNLRTKCGPLNWTHLVVGETLDIVFDFFILLPNRETPSWINMGHQTKFEDHYFKSHEGSRKTMDGKQTDLLGENACLLLVVQDSNSNHGLQA